MKRIQQIIVSIAFLSTLTIAGHAQKISTAGNQKVSASFRSANAANTVLNTKVLDAGIYYIKINNTGKYLGVEGIIRENGARLIEWDFAELDNHKFYIAKGADGYYTIKAMHSNRYLNIAGQSTEDGALVLQWDFVEQDNLKWMLQYSSSLKGWIVKNKQSGKEIKLAGGVSNNANGTLVVLNSNNQVGPQAFSFEPAVSMTVRNSSGTGIAGADTKMKLNPGVAQVLTGTIWLTNNSDVKVSVSTQKQTAVQRLKDTEYNKKNSRVKKNEVEPGSDCVVQTIELKNATTDQFIMNPIGKAKILPGQFYDITSFKTGNYASIGVPTLKPQILYTNLPLSETRINSNEPGTSNSATYQAINSLVNRPLTRKVPANMHYEFSQTNSFNESKFNLGFHFSGWGAKVNALFANESQQKKNRMTVEFVQVYYDINVDDQAIRSAQDWFTDGELPSSLDLAKTVYVARCTYGRRLYLVCESDESMDKMKVAVEASYSAGIAGGGLQVGSESYNTMSQMKIKGYVLGGNSTLATDVFINGMEGVYAFMRGSAEYDRNSTPELLSYELHFLNKDMAVVNTTSSFVSRTCPGSDGGDIEVTLMGISPGGGHQAVFGMDQMEVYGIVGCYLQIDPTDKRTASNLKELNLLPATNVNANVADAFNNGIPELTGKSRVLFRVGEKAAITTPWGPASPLKFKIRKEDIPNAKLIMIYNLYDYDSGDANDVLRDQQVSPVYIREVPFNNEGANIKHTLRGPEDPKDIVEILWKVIRK